MRIAGALALFAALCALAAPPASAQQGPPAASAAPSARAIELGRRFLVSAGIVDTMDEVIQAFLPPLIEAELGKNSAVSEREKQEVVEVAREVVREVMPQFITRMAPEVARTYTEAELEGMVAFFEGPVGRAFISKQAVLGPAGEKVMEGLLPQMETRMRERLCERLGCSPIEAEPRRS